MTEILKENFTCNCNCNCNTHDHLFDIPQVLTDSTSLASENFKNIQLFLNLFKAQLDPSIFSESFPCNLDVFVPKAQVPDLWSRTRAPFDRNQAYIEDNSSKWKKNLKLSTEYHHGKKIFKKCGNFPNMSRRLLPNLFPKVPLIISSNSDLLGRELPLDEIQIPCDLNINSIEKAFLPSFVAENAVPKDTPKELMMDHVQEKSWMISFSNDVKVINYGPLTSGKIYLFLRDMYAKICTEKRSKSIMIIDTSSDVHFHPETLYEILHQEFGKKLDKGKENNLMSRGLRVLKPEHLSSKYEAQGRWKRDSSGGHSTNYSSLKSEESVGADESKPRRKLPFGLKKSLLK